MSRLSLTLGRVGRLGESARPETEKVPEILQEFGSSDSQPLATILRCVCSYHAGAGGEIKPQASLIAQEGAHREEIATTNF